MRPVRGIVRRCDGQSLVIMLETGVRIAATGKFELGEEVWVIIDYSVMKVTRIWPVCSDLQEDNTEEVETEEVEGDSGDIDDSGFSLTEGDESDPALGSDDGDGKAASGLSLPVCDEGSELLGEPIGDSEILEFLELSNPLCDGQHWSCSQE